MEIDCERLKGWFLFSWQDESKEASNKKKAGTSN
jgi:hypothetical protein